MRYTGDTGAVSALSMERASSGETRSSASRHSTQSWLACSTANCFCRPKPSHSFCMTRAPLRRARSTVPSLEVESTTTISSTKARLSRHGSRTAAALRVMRTAERGARAAELKWTIPLESAGRILSNDNNTLRQDVLSWRCGAQLSGGERRGARTAFDGDRLGGGGGFRRDRPHAWLGAPRDPGGRATLALLAVETRGVARDRRVEARARRGALRCRGRHAIASQERAHRKSCARPAPRP